MLVGEEMLEGSGEFELVFDDPDAVGLLQIGDDVAEVFEGRPHADGDAELGGLAALIATHNVELAGRMDRRITLKEGRVVDMA